MLLIQTYVLTWWFQSEVLPGEKDTEYHAASLSAVHQPDHV